MNKKSLAYFSKSHEISDEDAGHLGHIAFGGLLQKKIPDRIRNNLELRKFIERKIGGDVITNQGHIALMIHKNNGRLK